MDNLTFEDFAKPVLKDIVLLGKKAYIRQVNIDQQFALEKLQDDQGLMLRTGLAMALCDADGEPIFPDIEVGVEKLKNIPASEIIDSFKVINDALDEQIEGAKKK